MTPTSYHKHNFPSESAIRAICKGKFLILCPLFLSAAEKKSHFNTVTENGALVIGDSGDDNNMSEVVDHPTPSFLTPKNKEDNVDDDDVDDNA